MSVKTRFIRYVGVPLPVDFYVGVVFSLIVFLHVECKHQITSQVFFG